MFQRRKINGVFISLCLHAHPHVYIACVSVGKVTDVIKQDGLMKPVSEVNLFLFRTTYLFFYTVLHFRFVHFFFFHPVCLWFNFDLIARHQLRHHTRHVLTFQRLFHFRLQPEIWLWQIGFCTWCVQQISICRDLSHLRSFFSWQSGLSFDVMAKQKFFTPALIPLPHFLNRRKVPLLSYSCGWTRNVLVPRILSLIALYRKHRRVPHA